MKVKTEPQRTSVGRHRGDTAGRASNLTGNVSASAGGGGGRWPEDKRATVAAVAAAYKTR